MRARTSDERLRGRARAWLAEQGYAALPDGTTSTRRRPAARLSMIELLIVAVVVLGYALVSQRLAASPVTAPMVFTAAGLLVGAGGLGWFDLTLEGEGTSLLVEATLVLVLFTDAIRIDLRALRRQAGLPGRLLGIGMPLTVLAGAGRRCCWCPGWASSRAPCWPPSSPPPTRPWARPSSATRGCPPGSARPSTSRAGSTTGSRSRWSPCCWRRSPPRPSVGPATGPGWLRGRSGFGLLAGLVAGVVGGKLLDLRATAGAVEGIYRQLATLSIAAAAYALAGVLDGNGFIAAFTAGLAFGAVAREGCRDVQDFTEDEGELLSAVTFLIFGAVLVGPELGALTWPIAAYVVASLTVVRVLPVLVALVGSGTLLETRLFLGWFGPRGLASILFALLVATELDSPASETIFTVAAWTVLVSVFAHGLTAHAWAGRLGRRVSALTEPMPETEPVPELPTRRTPPRASSDATSPRRRPTVRADRCLIGRGSLPDKQT